MTYITSLKYRDALKRCFKVSVNKLKVVEVPCHRELHIHTSNGKIKLSSVFYVEYHPATDENMLLAEM